MTIWTDPPPPPEPPVFQPYGFRRPGRRIRGRLRRIAAWLLLVLFTLAGMRLLDVALWTAWSVRP